MTKDITDIEIMISGELKFLIDNTKDINKDMWLPEPSKGCTDIPTMTRNMFRFLCDGDVVKKQKLAFISDRTLIEYYELAKIIDDNYGSLIGD